MIVKLEPAVLGTESPIFLDTDSGRMGRAPMGGQIMTLGRGDRGSLGEWLRVEGREVDLTPPIKYGRMMGSLGCPSPPWSQVMARSEWKRWVCRISRSIREMVRLLEPGYYEGAFRKGSRVLAQLTRARVDHDDWTRCMANQAAGAVASFEPDDDGLAPPIRYTRWGTRTGRLGVESGPQILTLKKAYRGMLRSRWPDGELHMFDYVSFEAQLALMFSGREPRADVYDDVSNELFGGEVPRQAAKIASMALLFGGSDALIGRKLGLSNGELQRAIADLKGYFGVRELEDVLLEQLDDESHIRNRYGRRIPVPEGERRLIVNTFIQSSAVDAALQGFARLLDVLGDDGVPLFIIHDALLVDLKPSGVGKIPELLTAVSQVPTFDHPLPCRAERIRPLYTGTEVQ